MAISCLVTLSRFAIIPQPLSIAKLFFNRPKGNVMKHFRSLNLAIASFMLALVVGCAALGSATPDTFNQKLAVGVATVAEVRTTAATLLQAGKISVADAKNVQASADVAREGFNVARGLASTDLTAASTRLDVANAALKALQAYLVTKQGAPK